MLLCGVRILRYINKNTYVSARKREASKVTVRKESRIEYGLNRRLQYVLLQEFLDFVLQDFHGERGSSCITNDEPFMGGHSCTARIVMEGGVRFEVTGVLYNGGGVKDLEVLPATRNCLKNE
ncbi:hypothetical protein AB6A40_006642 [Gnathostoma spinigerum]|uniref:Uncharacterized protein n=1 Tax=Gnathostoma spinigerum TaxID=75299 RepID=A0ABD6ESD1_9BILA